jgi:hypothetical protein
MKKLIFMLLAACFLAACDSMDANYRDYLKDIPQYSPRVTNLKAEVPERGTVVLTWTNPIGDTAVKIRIDTGDNHYDTSGMVETYTLEGLEVKGYMIAVYTIDRYGNLSVPSTAPAFPKVEE